MKKYVLTFVISFAVLIALLGGTIIYIDPLFVYHGPVASLYYELDSNQRYQNPGIVKHFDYNGIITGTSVTQNFSVEEFENKFGVTSVKTSLSGATFHEIGSQLKSSFASGHDLKVALVSLDPNHMIEDKDARRDDLGAYPDYLESASPFDDVEYVLNKDIFLNNCLPVIQAALQGKEGGVTSMEEYNRMPPGPVGNEAVINESHASYFYGPQEEEQSLTAEEITMVTENVQQNIVDVVNAHPDTQFIYFIEPLSIVWWGDIWDLGQMKKTVESEKIAASMLVQCPNVKLYCFTNDLDIAGDLNNYYDSVHYAENVNELLMDNFGTENYLMTADNYESILDEQYDIFEHYDYNVIFQ